jgi:type IV secretory pathway VirB2 component (pilin)
MNTIYRIYNAAIFSVFTFLFCSESLANRLQEAAQRGQGIVISIAQITAVIGIVLGGMALSIGMSGLGRMVLVSGIFGAAATFGGPAFIDLMKDVFK